MFNKKKKAPGRPKKDALTEEDLKKRIEELEKEKEAFLSEKLDPEQEEFGDPAEVSDVEDDGIEEVGDKVETTDKKLPPMPTPPTEQPKALTPQEVLTVAEDHLARAVELIRYARTIK